jgi:antitoxin (DNA-binding transcriptional repressor) of toxin-antitoxin stability system
MPMTATELRSRLYRVLDQVLETGEPVEILRKGRRVRISAAEESAPHDLLQRLEPHPDFVSGDPDDLVHLDWSDTWRP